MGEFGTIAHTASSDVSVMTFHHQGVVAMRTTMNLACESSVKPTSFHLRAVLMPATRRVWAILRQALSTEPGERYQMLHEDLLRGPLSAEIRRAPWL
jgi:hypothetical protein